MNKKSATIFFGERRQKALGLHMAQELALREVLGVAQLHWWKRWGWR